MLACTVEYRQNVGHIGTEVNVLAVHGHYRTMKKQWAKPFKEFWDRLAQWIRDHQIHFFAGDFNMSLTQVINQLKERGIKCDCCAWYPWRHARTQVHGQSLGFDSQAIFYVGGKVQVKLDWGIDSIPEITAVAEDLKQSSLHEYDGQNVPGQHWACYRSYRGNDADHEKDLAQMLQDLLQQSTNQAELDDIPKRPWANYCPYIRIKQKK